MTLRLKIKRRKTGKVELSRTKSRYRFKPGFADDVKQRSRKIYRKEKGKDFELVGSVVLRALKHLDLEAEVKPVVNQLTSETELLPVIGLTHAAKLLNTTYQTFWRWTSETQQLPMPVLIDNATGREYGCYHVDEVRVMVTIIGAHLCNFKYFRKDHELVVRKLFNQIEALRAVNFNNSKEDTNGNSQQRPKARRKIKIRRRRAS